MATMILEIKFALSAPISASHARTLLPASLATPAREIFCKIASALMATMMMESANRASPACHNA